MAEKEFIDQDFIRLRDMIDAELRHTEIEDQRESLHFLASVLEQGKVISSQNIPAEIVTMGVWFRLRDLDTYEEISYTLVYPQDADLAQNRLSILTPLGMAILGLRVNETVDWQTPEGMRHLKIMAVRHYAKSNNE